MSNLFAIFKGLLPQTPLQVGTVLAESNGTVTIELPGGATATARGEAAVGDRVFFRDSLIEGPAPNLPLVSLEL